MADDYFYPIKTIIFYQKNYHEKQCKTNAFEMLNIHESAKTKVFALLTPILKMQILCSQQQQVDLPQKWLPIRDQFAGQGSTLRNSVAVHSAMQESNKKIFSCGAHLMGTKLLKQCITYDNFDFVYSASLLFFFYIYSNL